MNTNKIKHFIANYSNYQLPNNVPKEFKNTWFRLLIKSHYKYKIAFIITKLFNFFRGSQISKISQLSSRKKCVISDFVKKERIPFYYYFYFNFSDDSRWKLRHQFIYQSYLEHCLRYLIHSEQSQILSNKLEFYFFCKKNNISTPEIYGYIKENDINWFWREKIFKQKSNFITKPIYGSKGEGFKIFKYDNISKVYIDMNLQKRISLSELNNYLIKNTSQDSIIQELLINHSKLNSIGNGELAIIRLLSIRTSDDEILLIRPIIKIPEGKTILSYFHLGAQAFKINLDSGHLESPLKRGSRMETVELSKLFSTVKLPYWKEIKRLTKKIHLQLDKTILVGWDIAITNENLFFLEGNLSPYLDIHQKVPFSPFLNAPFYKALIYHLNNNKDTSTIKYQD